MGGGGRLLISCNDSALIKSLLLNTMREEGWGANSGEGAITAWVLIRGNTVFMVRT